MLQKLNACFSYELLNSLPAILSDIYEPIHKISTFKANLHAQWNYRN